ncbi:MAG: hypothetical protein Q4E49_05395 [Bacteroidales bacterium]|nr:hypothetical protein [Bacteroidales bacterium]
MKKYLLFFASAMMMLAACNSDSVFDEPTPSPAPAITTPQTAVKAGFAKSTGAGSILFDETPVAAEPTATIKTKFSVRIDNRIPRKEASGKDYNIKDYYTVCVPTGPFNNNKSNRANFAYGRLYDNGDYKTPKPGFTTNVTHYLYDPTGEDIEGLFAETPDFKACLEADTRFKDIDWDNVKIIWYVVKRQKEVDLGTADYWHVDGLVTFPDVDKIDDVPDSEPDDIDYFNDDPDWKDGEVEVDIHQQEHLNWNEIKTSIHIREAVDVTVEIPIGDQYLAEADDFRIRVWTAYYTIDNTEYPVTITTKHFVNKIVIKVTGVTQELIDKAKTQSDGDGITVEVNSYYENITHELAWEKLKKATVTTDAKTNIRGQITSAFFTENDSPTDQKVIISYTKADYDHDYPPTE